MTYLGQTHEKSERVVCEAKGSARAGRTTKDSCLGNKRKAGLCQDSPVLADSLQARLLANCSNLCCRNLLWASDKVFKIHLIPEIHLRGASLKDKAFLAPIRHRELDLRGINNEDNEKGRHPAATHWQPCWLNQYRSVAKLGVGDCERIQAPGINSTAGGHGPWGKRIE